MISVVIPAYNESANIQLTVNEIIKGLKSTAYVKRFEILVMDDHSSDGTFEQVVNMQLPEVRGIRLSQNCGSYTAIRAGLNEANGDAVICISADGQDNPEAIPKMVEKWANGAQVVWALRKSRDNEPWLIKLPALLFYKILRWVTPKYISVSKMISRADFFLLDRKVVNAINTCKERSTSLVGLILWSGFNQNFVEYDRKTRRYGNSKWNFSRRLDLAKDWIIAFSGIPLRSMLWIGFTIAFLGLFYALFVFILHFTEGNAVEGWTSIMIVLLIIGGLNIAMLGLIGEYLWRNLEESRKRPLYFIEKNSAQDI